MARAIRLVIDGVSHDDNILRMVVRENFDIYRGTHDIIMDSIARTTGIVDIENNTFAYCYISQAIYDARMKGSNHIVVDGFEGREYQVYLKVGDEIDLIQD